MKKALACVLVLGMVSSVYGVGMYMLPGTGEGTLGAYSFGSSLAVAPNGTAYVSGQANNATGYRGAYWTYSNGAVSAPTIIPTNAGNTISSNAYGIGLLANGYLVVGGRQPADGAATWTNAPGVANNGWLTHFLPSSSQATTPREQNLIRVANDGTTAYVLGKSSSGDWMGSWAIDSTNGYAQAVDAFGLAGGSGATAKGISANGIAIGDLTTGGVVRAFVHGSGGTSILPIPGDSNRTEAYEISADGNTAVGLARYTGDNIQYGAYWTNNGGTWTANWLGAVPGATSTQSAYAVNENGSLFGGSGYISGVYKATLWDPSDLDEYGQPTAIFLEDYLATHGITVPSELTVLNRVHSISTVNGLTYITGYGNSLNRGFLIVVPEPATAMFLLLGGLTLLRRRH